MKINVNPINIKKVDEDHFRAVIQIKNLINVVLEVSKYNYIDFKEKWKCTFISYNQNVRFTDDGVTSYSKYGFNTKEEAMEYLEKVYKEYVTTYIETFMKDLNIYVTIEI